MCVYNRSAYNDGIQAGAFERAPGAAGHALQVRPQVRLLLLRVRQTQVSLIVPAQRIEAKK